MNVLPSRHYEAHPPCPGHRKLQQLTSQSLQAFVTAKRKEGLSDNYVRDMFMILSGILNRAVAWDKIPVNPLRMKGGKGGEYSSHNTTMAVYTQSNPTLLRQGAEAVWEALDQSGDSATA
jgi:hypothetical protein